MSAKVTQDVTAIANYAGTYDKTLIGRLLDELEIAQDFYVMRNVRAPRRLVKLTITKGIRPLDTSVDTVDEAGRVWSGRTIEVKGGMKIIEVIPEELRDTFMSEMLAVNAEEVPFAEFVWTEEFKTLAEEINESVFFADFKADAAAFDAAATYAIGDYVNFEKSIYMASAATTAGQSPTTHPAKWEKRNDTSILTGPGTILKKAITNGELVPIPTNVFSATNTVAELQKVWKATPYKFRKKKTKLRVAPHVMEFYKADYDTRFGKGNGIADDTEDRDVIYLKGTGKKCQLVECNYMGDTNGVFLTLAEGNNCVMATDKMSDLNSIGKMIQTLHGFKAVIKYLMGFQFQDLEVVYVNDKF